jgi:NADP-dependent 3-hydroxy acid dehydrogenase YdfG
MTAIRDKVIAVTGAASGIGRGLARELALRGAHLAIADIDAAGLAETASSMPGIGKTTSHIVDVRDRRAVERYAAEVKREHGGADVIINNAGVTTRASIEDSPIEDFELVLGVNLWGVIYGTKAFMPLFRERGAGHIVNVASINAMVPFAKNGPYNISKYAVYGLNETLMQELQSDTIRVTSVHPGGVRTNIARNARHMSQAEAELFSRIAGLTPEKAAKIIVSAIEKNKQRVYVGTDSKLMAAAKRAAPGLTVALVGYLSGKFVSERTSGR